MPEPEFWVPYRTTIYKGIKMRSRLEAKWAADFDEELEDHYLLSWEYEPAAFASGKRQYLPDFRLRYGPGSGMPASLYVDVKGRLDDPDELMLRMEIILASEPDAQLEIRVGSPDDDMAPVWRGLIEVIEGHRWIVWFMDQHISFDLVMLDRLVPFDGQSPRPERVLMFGPPRELRAVLP